MAALEKRGSFQNTETRSEPAGAVPDGIIAVASLVEARVTVVATDALRVVFLIATFSVSREENEPTVASFRAMAERLSAKEESEESVEPVTADKFSITSRHALI